MRLLHPLTVVLAVTLWMAQPTSAEAATTIALWHMNGTGTVMTDASGNGLVGALSQVSTGQPGLAGTAYGFATTPSFVKVAHSAKLNPGRGAFTVRASVRFALKPTRAVVDYDIIRKGLATTTGGGWKIEIMLNGYPTCIFRGSGGTVRISHGPSLADGKWHTITCRRSTSGVRLTVGASSWSKAGATGTIANTSPVYIGAKGPEGNDQYAGLLDEVKVSAG